MQTPLDKLTDDVRKNMSNLDILDYYFNIKKQPFFQVKFNTRIYSYDELIPESKIMWDNKDFLLENFPHNHYVYISEEKIEGIGNFHELNKLRIDYTQKTGKELFCRRIGDLLDWKLKN